MLTSNEELVINAIILDAEYCRSRPCNLFTMKNILLRNLNTAAQLYHLKITQEFINDIIKALNDKFIHTDSLSRGADYCFASFEAKKLIIDGEFTKILIDNNLYAAIPEETKLFLKDLLDHMNRIDKTAYGDSLLKKSKLAALDELRLQLVSNPEKLPKEIVQDWSKSTSFYENKSNYDLIGIHRRTGFLGMFNRANTNSKDMIDKFVGSLSGHKTVPH